MNKLEKHIQESPLVRAAIVEAVHRFYYDRILSTKKQDQDDIKECEVDEILDKLWNLHPDWRHTLLTIPKRYEGNPTNAVSIHGKPKREDKFVSPEITFE